MGIGIGMATLLAVIIYAMWHPWLMLWCSNLFRDEGDDER